MKISYIILTIGLCCINLCAQQSESKLDKTASQIVQAMTDKYSKFSSFQDSGMMGVGKDMNKFKSRSWEEALTSNDFERLDLVTFNFYFKRPNLLRFEWLNSKTEDKRKSVVWSNGKHAYSWKSSGFDETFIWYRESSLKWAIDESTRGSLSISQLLYNALSGSNEYFSYNKMSNAQILREEVVDGYKCYVIIGTISNDLWVLWIDKNTFLLHKYRTMIATGSFHEPGPFLVGEFIHQNIETDRPISNEIFNFKPNLIKGDMDISNPKEENLNAPPAIYIPEKPKSK